MKQGLKYNKNLSKSTHKINNNDDSKNYLILNINNILYIKMIELN